MISKIKNWFIQRKQKQAERKNLDKMQKYYKLIRSGVSLVQFIQKDLKDKANKMNRDQRRRLSKTVLKGEFTEELVNHYKNEIDRILINIEKEQEKVNG